MNPACQPPPLPTGGFRWWHWILGVLVLCLAGGGLLVWQAVTPAHEVRMLRESVRKVRGTPPEAVFQLNVGALPMALARIGGSFLPIPSEAQVALDTLRGASVGVYRAEPHGRGRELLEAADRSLTARGWERTVGVIDGEQVVGVYVPRDLTSPRKMRVAVLVQSSDQLVLVTARANLNPLLDWIRKQTGGKSRLFPDAPFAFR